MDKLRRGTAWVAWLVGLSFFAWLVYLEASFASTMPRISDPTRQRTVPVVVRRGTHVFVSRQEATRLDSARSLMKWGVMLCAFGTIVAGVSGRARYE
jgi:hypothetical protein